jgi:hypothetical protein
MMIDRYKIFITELENELNFITTEIDDPIEAAEKAIESISRALGKLKTSVIETSFQSQDDEIDFFKNIKPKILSKLIYYSSVHKIEINKPNGGEKIIRKYFNNELLKLKIFFDNNLEFYRYYRTGSTFLDNKFFIRGTYDLKLNIETNYFDADHRFTTSHDNIIAKIMASDQIQLYLEAELTTLEKIQPPEKTQLNPKSQQTWTGSKVALIELIYALHSEAVFNNGTSDLKSVFEFFENILKIELGQYHRTFLEIRVRKTNRTKFLDSLKDTLVKKMDVIEE